MQGELQSTESCTTDQKYLCTAYVAVNLTVLLYQQNLHQQCAVRYGAGGFQRHMLAYITRFILSVHPMPCTYICTTRQVLKWVVADTTSISVH